MARRRGIPYRPLPEHIYRDRNRRMLGIGALVKVFTDGRAVGPRARVIGFDHEFVVVDLGNGVDDELRKFEHNVELLDLDFDMDEGL